MQYLVSVSKSEYYMTEEKPKDNLKFITIDLSATEFPQEYIIVDETFKPLDGDIFLVHIYEDEFNLLLDKLRSLEGYCLDMLYYVLEKLDLDFSYHNINPVEVVL